jgi:hypothetical protein
MEVPEGPEDNAIDTPDVWGHPRIPPSLLAATSTWDTPIPTHHVGD